MLQLCRVGDCGQHPPRCDACSPHFNHPPSFVMAASLAQTSCERPGTTKHAGRHTLPPGLALP